MKDGKMHIGYIIPGWDFYNGCIHFRNFLPALGLARREHAVDFILLGEQIGPENFQDIDVVVFSRALPPQIIQLVEIIKGMKKKIIYETDDDLENLDETNPTRAPIGRMQSGIKMMCWEADAITTTTPYLAKVLKTRYPAAKEIYVCPNTLDLDQYRGRRPHDDLIIGWSGGCSHAVDLLEVLDPLLELDKKHDFTFILQGFTMGMVDGQEWVWKRMLDISGERQEQYYYIVKALEMCSKFREFKKFEHIPFYPTEYFPRVLHRMSLDIGLAPLLDSTFNMSKSCIKFYEYAATDTVTLASNVVPYNTELSLVVDNKKEDWIAEIEQMITDKDFREKTLKEQKEFVLAERSLTKGAEMWEKAFMEVLNG